MPGRSPLPTTEEQRAELKALAESRDRGEAYQAGAVLLTVAGWTSPQTGEAFGVREDTVRLWRSDFMNGGVAAMKATVAPDPAAGSGAPVDVGRPRQRVSGVVGESRLAGGDDCRPSGS